VDNNNNNFFLIVLGMMVNNLLSSSITAWIPTEEGTRATGKSDRFFYCNWAHTMKVNLVLFFKYILFGKAK
jgi:hypothetical protein